VTAIATAAVGDSGFVFVSDLHGCPERYRALFGVIEQERPAAVFLGGDLLPHHWTASLGGGDVVRELLEPGLRELQVRLGAAYPAIFVILGNDDDRASEASVLELDRGGVWRYAHERWHDLGAHPVLGYSHVPPTPFQLKDWERYDVSRFIDPGCVSPEHGVRTVVVSADEARYRTIAGDLDGLTANRGLDRAVMLFHTPPYGCELDRAALDDRSFDNVPLDVHVGSIAVRRFIESRQPLLTLHGHIHEAPRLTGVWRTRIGRTHCFTAAHDGPELAVVRFDLGDLESATRELI
jgi:Icc-related predicted phosphoesterase